MGLPSMMGFALFTSCGFVLTGACSIVAAAQEPSKTGTEKPDKPAQKDAAPKPGKDRWKVKTAADADAKAISAKATISTVEKLLALPRPADFPTGPTPEKYQESRAGDVEKTLYTVEADVVECRLMPDGDYRVVIKGASGKTIVLEMPDPSPEFVDPNGPFAYAIKSARHQFDEKAKPERTAKPLKLHAKITGLGFFGRAYGNQKPPEGNLIQLHPVVNLEWMEKPSNEFAHEAAKAPSQPDDPNAGTAKPKP